MPEVAERTRLSRVLIVEDHPHQLRTLTDLLEAEGIEAIGVSTGTEALAALEREEVGIVVVDLHLPDGNGTALLERLRARSKTTRIIIHTGYGSFATAKDAVNLGAFAYIEKGEDPHELISHVHRAREANLTRYAESLEAAVAQRTAELERRFIDLRNLHDLVSRLNSAELLGEIYDAAMDALSQTLRPDRASILLFDPDGVMRFKAWCGLSDWYRQAVEGHSPWKPDTADAQPILISDAAEDASLGPHQSTILKEGIRALAFIPLIAQGRVIGNFMLYCDAPRRLTDEEVRLAQTIAAHVAFAVTRKQAAEVLYERERAMRTLVASLPGVVYRCLNDPNWTLEYISDQVRDLVGYGPDEFLSRSVTWAQLIHPDDVGRVWNEVQAAVAQARPYQLEYRIRAHDGRELSVWEQGQAVTRPDWSVAALEGFIMDITERKRAEETLRSSLSTLQALINSSQSGVLLEDPQRKVVFANPALCILFGIPTPESLVGCDCREAARQCEQKFEDPERFAQRIEETMARGEPVRGEQLKLRDGRIFERDYVAVRTGDVLIGQLWIYRDMTDRVRAERTLAASEDRYRALYEENPSMYFTLAVDGTVLSVNQFGARQLGYVAEELVGRSVLTVLHKEDRPRVQDSLVALLAHPDRIGHWEFRKVRKDGTLLWVKETARLVHQDGGIPVVLVVCEDITERKQAEEALRRSYEERDRISQDLHDGILQSLYAIGLGLEVTKREVKPASRAMVQRLDGSIVQLNALVQEVRSFIGRVTTPSGEVRDLAQAIQALTGSFAATGAGEIAVRLDPSIAASFSAEHCAHLVNVVKEALSNSVRHARAAHRSVTLGRSRGGVRLEIRDDGVGFRVSQRRGAGMGLSTMRARAKKLGGRLSILSRPGCGTRVLLDLPVPRLR